MRGLASITIYQQQEIDSLHRSLVNQEQVLMGQLEVINTHIAQLARETAMQRARPGPVAQRRLRDAERRWQWFLRSDSNGPVAGPSTGPGTLTGTGMAENPHTLVEIHSEEEDQGVEVETVRRVVVVELALRRSVAPPYEAPPNYFPPVVIAEDAGETRDEEGEVSVTDDDLYAAVK